MMYDNEGAHTTCMAGIILDHLDWTYLHQFPFRAFQRASNVALHSPRSASLSTTFVTFRYPMASLTTTPFLKLFLAYSTRDDESKVRFAALGVRKVLFTIRLSAGSGMPDCVFGIVCLWDVSDIPECFEICCCLMMGLDEGWRTANGS